MDQMKSIYQNNTNKFNKGLMNSQIKRGELKFNMSNKMQVAPQQIEIDNGTMKSKIFYNPNLLNNQTLLNQPLKPDIKEKERIRLPIREGFLMKESPHLLQGFQKRFCRLENRVLYYYIAPDNKEFNQLFGVLNFDIQSYIYSDKKKNDQIIEFTLQPKGCEKKFTFKGQSVQETHSWALALSEHLKQSLGRQSDLLKFSKVPRFWRNESISYQQVLEDAEDGDIILFRAADFVSQAQRSLTGSEYDHVGVCYRDQNDLWVFEAVSSGVGTFKWSYMKSQDWGQTIYQKVGYRRLENVVRDSVFKNQLFNFINENIGKDYSISIGKLTTLVSCIKPKIEQTQQNYNENDQENDKEKERTFFCSELVAKTYKILGLLDQVKSSTQYYPYHFSSACKTLGLLKGAKLSSEYCVNFT